LQQMMGGLGQNLGMLGRIPGMKGLAAARHLRRAMKGGGMPGMGMPGVGVPGMGMPSIGLPGVGMPQMPGWGAGAPEDTVRMRQVSKTERNAKKNLRKRERDARKKSKGKK